MTQRKKPESKVPTTKKEVRSKIALKKAATSLEQKKDKFGCRIGTEGAAIDAKLSAKPITVESLMSATKLSKPRIRGHLRFLMKKKLVKETEKGFVATLK